MGKVVLIAEDEAVMLETVTQVCLDMGFECLTASNGLEACQILETVCPHFIFTDYRMPLMDGLQLIHNAREKYPKIVTAIFSGYADKESIVAFLHEGVNFYIEKPFTLDVLKAQILKCDRAADDLIQREKNELQEIVELFTEEALLLFEDFETVLMQMDSHGFEKSLIENLFRKVHSVKGGAKAIPPAFALGDICHALESVFDQLRIQQIPCPSAALSILLQAQDQIVKLLSMLREGKPYDSKTLENTHSITDALLGLKESLSQMKAPTKDGVPATVGVAKTSSASGELDGVFVTHENMDRFMSISGDLSVLKNFFESLILDLHHSQSVQEVARKLQDLRLGLTNIAFDLQDHVMTVREVRLKRYLSRLPRIIRDLSNQLGKKVQLSIDGEEMMIDKKIAEIVSSCLTHIIRNSMDHGIETPDIRSAQNKKDLGTILIKANRRTDMMKIEISDDGGGIAVDKVLAKAIKNGLFKDNANNNSNGKMQPSDEEIINLIFHSGFSTAEVVTEVSGRGVGMDFVKTSIEQIGGHISVQTKRHVGTTFTLNIPTPKTIMTEKTMLAKSNNIIVAIPIANVRKFLKCDNVAVTEFGGSRAITYQDQVIPMMTYNEMTMGQSETVSLGGKICVLLKDRVHLVGLIVDEIIGPCDAVLRPLDLQILDKLCFKGITLLDTRTIAYILDAEKLLAKAFVHKTDKIEDLQKVG